jgi:hypothetical protein
LADADVEWRAKIVGEAIVERDRLVVVTARRAPWKRRRR